MKQINDIKDIVVLGAWNIAIFTPEWMKQYVLSQYENINIEVALSTNASLRFTTKDFIFAIVNNRLELIIRESSEEAITCLRSIFQKLIHTPVSAMGVNYKFKANKVEFNIDLYNEIFSENMFPNTIGDCQLDSISNTALYSIDDKNKLRLSVTKENDDVIFDFNFNFPLKSAEDAINILGVENSIVQEYKDKALGILATKYSLIEK